MTDNEKLFWYCQNKGFDAPPRTRGTVIVYHPGGESSFRFYIKNYEPEFYARYRILL